MSSSYVFETPANIKDFQLASSYQKWSDWISEQNNNNIKSNVAPCSIYSGVEDRYPGLTSQYYNPAVTPVANTGNAVIPWNGFPLRIQSEFPPESDAMYEAAENPLPVGKSKFLQHYFDDWQPYANVSMRVQDEYLEWFSTRDSSGNLVKVDFVCEGPEYWQNMHDWEPDTLVKLYRQYISPNVQLADLEWIDPLGDPTKLVYNPYNKWNVSEGIMHLNCPPNSLGAEINLAAFATVPHGTAEDPMTDPVELTKCGQFGNPSRNSDPHIGSAVNKLCLQGKMVTCANPVGLYIQEIDTQSWFRAGVQISPSEIAQIVQYVRGTKAANPNTDPGRVLRVTVSVPPSLGYKLSDITIGGSPLKFGGQIAENISMSLSGTAGDGPVKAQPFQLCMNKTCPTGLSAQQTQSHALKAAAHIKTALRFARR